MRVILKIRKYYKTETMGLIVRAELVGEMFMEGYLQLKEML